MIFWPCGICRKNCKIASICCDNCDTWYHLRCEELELADFEMFLTDKNVNYSCKGCFSHDQSDEYTYTSALFRLTEAGEKGFDYLRFCCKREKGMLPTMTKAEYSEEKLHGGTLGPCYIQTAVGTIQYERECYNKSWSHKDGLLSSPDDVEFDLKVMQLEAKYEHSVPAFQRYFSSNTSSLKSYVWEPAQKDIAPINWKNNACESMNNILKLSTNWKAVKLPDLIDKLHKIVQLQYRDIRRALHGQGNYALAPWARKLQVIKVVWSSKCAKKVYEFKQT
ncbi:unnamed protein product [Mytilus coruscus]|uniref:Zinc finger PHD-type domain-containing protein n=1 Tax=Mytilus coruscus TaxID=42192 RepID=A0A6J8ATQ4_MYTCO|nr:unnamed protein product [Mytilus coruscus]